MSDSEGDFSDELLELAGATEKKRRKRQERSGGGKSKRRRPEVSDSDESMVESEEDENVDPYPLEGKYKNEADREHLMELPEIEREEIIAQRLEEMQRLQDKRSLDAMVRMQRKDSGGVSGDPDAVAKAAKRQHAVRGATKEKSRKLDELKAKRRAKDEKRRTKGGPGSPKRERSSSPDDMEMSSEEEEDGQISRLEQEEERDRKLYGQSTSDDDSLTLEDLSKCRLTRDMIAKTCMTPWFEDYVKGAFVRYLIGQEGKQPIYRICEVDNLAPDFCRPYKINDQSVNQNFELRHGKSTKIFPMDKVSNAPFEQREFDRWVKVCQSENVSIPSRRQLEKKSAQLVKLSNQTMTETDVMKMLEKRRALQSETMSGAALTLEKSRLTQARMLAARRQDWDEVSQIDAQLEALGGTVTGGTARRVEEDDAGVRMAKVNERNRKANLEAVRRMELAEAERKRLRRKLESSRTATPDPNASVKSEVPSRTATPSNGETKPLTVTGPPPSAVSGTQSRVKETFDDTIVDEIDIDLGDF